MKVQHIKTQSKIYPVIIDKKAIFSITDILAEKFKNHKIWIITDENVAPLYLDFVKTAIKSKLQSPIFHTIVPGGEEAKSLEVFQACHTDALQAGLNRKSIVLALGGGAVGDLAGFVAATYMRGIPFIQIPTTILAHDSAVGGKVAVNHPLGKNMIGTFYQPEAVIYHLDFLSTLPKKEVLSGYAEAIKHSLIAPKPFYTEMRNRIVSFEDIADENLSWFLEEGIEVKSNIVAEDEKETGVRAYLNFGHTLGHAIEAQLGYGVISHGEAVLLGMVFALQLSIEYIELEFDLAQFKKWAQDLGYTLRIPKELEPTTLLSTMKKDKKTTTDRVRFVLLSSVGSPVMKEFSDVEISKVLQTMY
ncbi:3-dehydroquinate synthase [Peribacillus alkalitolerans]|uniref:3-dehydroquinate synthase n=1 Tax=Peribacillus alkalitolerans TaxID=1550385 RepID=UPI0013D690E7|nr:3-dehydroquinate synthase [Peribacillus alkalitolerans]